MLSLAACSAQDCMDTYVDCIYVLFFYEQINDYVDDELQAQQQ